MPNFVPLPPISPGIGVRYNNTNARARARDLRGQFASIQTEIKAAHEAMAMRLQELERDALQDSVEATGRPQRDTRYLLEALVADGNRVVSADGFVVNIESFLSSTRAAPYYRHLEEGYTGFVGREMRGFFKSKGGGIFGPSASRYRRDLEMIQLGATFGGKPGNTLSLGNLQRKDGSLRVRRAEETSLPELVPGHHTSTLSGRTVPNANRGEPGNPAPSSTVPRGESTPRVTDHGQGFKIIIHNPIPAYEYIARGVAQWEASGITDIEYRKALAKFAGLVKFTTAKGNVGAIR